MFTFFVDSLFHHLRNRGDFGTGPKASGSAMLVMAMGEAERLLWNQSKLGVTHDLPKKNGDFMGFYGDDYGNLRDFNGTIWLWLT